MIQTKIKKNPATNAAGLINYILPRYYLLGSLRKQEKSDIKITTINTTMKNTPVSGIISEPSPTTAVKAIEPIA